MYESELVLRKHCHSDHFRNHKHFRSLIRIFSVLFCVVYDRNILLRYNTLRLALQGELMKAHNWMYDSLIAHVVPAHVAKLNSEIEQICLQRLTRLIAVQTYRANQRIGLLQQELGC